jgi:hypothetical protein
MSREFTNKLHDMVAFEYITEGKLLSYCLYWMDEAMVKDMCNHVVELSELFDDEESGLNFIHDDDDEELYRDIVVGDEVYYNDPLGYISGKYLVMAIDTEGGRVLSADDMITLGNSLEDIYTPAKYID